MKTILAAVLTLGLCVPSVRAEEDVPWTFDNVVSEVKALKKDKEEKDKLLAEMKKDIDYLKFRDAPAKTVGQSAPLGPPSSGFGVGVTVGGAGFGIDPVTKVVRYPVGYTAIQGSSIIRGAVPAPMVVNLAKWNSAEWNELATHLMREHGYSADQLTDRTLEELKAFHNAAHGGPATMAGRSGSLTTFYSQSSYGASGSCANGQCDTADGRWKPLGGAFRLRK